MRRRRERRVPSTPFNRALGCLYGVMGFWSSSFSSSFYNFLISNQTCLFSSFVEGAKYYRYIFVILYIEKYN
ncbi:hypothetical protein Scep_003675 [Stephania cephalantha]|uniref:Uncharacterized protein n=1 Tax=Stephania cephalantha TaxID=152367 RepID=A0AAP0KQZ2_9MAGN